MEFRRILEQMTASKARVIGSFIGLVALFVGITAASNSLPTPYGLVVIIVAGLLLAPLGNELRKAYERQHPDR